MGPPSQITGKNPSLVNHPNFPKINHRKCGVGTVFRIIGGQNASVGQFPWMALLRYVSTDDEKKETYGCGGSLISIRHVLTAAHCIQPVKLNLWVNPLWTPNFDRNWNKFQTFSSSRRAHNFNSCRLWYSKRSNFLQHRQPTISRLRNRGYDCS